MSQAEAPKCLGAFENMLLGMADAACHNLGASMDDTQQMPELMDRLQRLMRQVSGGSAGPDRGADADDASASAAATATRAETVALLSKLLTALFAMAVLRGSATHILRIVRRLVLLPHSLGGARGTDNDGDAGGDGGGDSSGMTLELDVLKYLLQVSATVHKHRTQAVHDTNLLQPGFIHHPLSAKQAASMPSATSDHATPSRMDGGADGSNDQTHASCACDGVFVFVHTQEGLAKIGTGRCGTLPGHVYAINPEFYPNEYVPCWVACSCAAHVLALASGCVRGAQRLPGRS